MFLHINPMEPQAANLALKIFSPYRINQVVSHSTSNRQSGSRFIYKPSGGTHSKLLCQLSLGLWNWSLSRQIHASARYIPGIFNKHADHMSGRLRLTNCRMEVEPYSVPKDSWIPQIDLFATRANTQLRKFVSWIPDHQCSAIDAFSIQWSDPLSYTFPPFSLIMRCVQRLKNQKGKILLVTPVWRSRP